MAAKTKNNKTNKKVKKSNKKKYKVRNWKEYNEALRQRGSIEVLVDKKVLDEWFSDIKKKQEEKRRKGRQNKYSDKAIELTLQFGKVFRQKLRQTEGLVKSIFSIMKLNLDVPDFSTLSRRAGKLIVVIPKDAKDIVAIVVDSSGLKVFGEGEWKVRKHGYSKHRTWKKMHIAITPDGEVRAGKLTGNNCTDEQALPDLLNQENAEIEKLFGDGAYDKKSIYKICMENGIDPIIPPQKNAKITQHGNCRGNPYSRDENLRKIRKSTRKQWKILSGYHTRSLAETTMFRFKSIFGDKLNSRKDENQNTEFMLSLKTLNQMSKLGMPDSCAIA